VSALKCVRRLSIEVSKGSAPHRLDCRTEIASRLRANHGLHASYGLQADSSQACARCHSEHNGEDFAIVK